MAFNGFYAIGFFTLCTISPRIWSFINDPDCSHNCTLGGNWYCGPIPCPWIPCDVERVWTKPDCCEHCPTSKQDDEVWPTVSTKNVTAHFCPFPCTVGNETLCYPPPCPPPACVDPARHQPTDCCVYCPNGPNCRGPHGSKIPYDHWKIVDGKNCTCKSPSMDADCV